MSYVALGKEHDQQQEKKPAQNKDASTSVSQSSACSQLVNCHDTASTNACNLSPVQN